MDVIDVSQVTLRLRPQQPVRIEDDPDLEGHRSARLLSRIESTIDFGHSHYRSAVQNVSKQILKDHLPVPLLKKFRDFKVFAKKLKKAMGKQEYSIATHLKKNKPVYNLDHLIRER